MRIVVKVGTSTLAHSTGHLNIRRVEHLCKVMSDIKNAGHELILRKDNGYGWNPSASITLDTETLDQLYSEQQQNEDLSNALKILQLYSGDFLEKLSAFAWSQSLATHYHEIYMEVLLKTLPQLMKQKLFTEVTELCPVASSLEPFHTEIHLYWMRALMEIGQPEEATHVYQALSDRLLSKYGILPTEELRALAREASRAKNNYSVTIDVIAEDLHLGERIGGRVHGALNAAHVTFHQHRQDHGRLAFQQQGIANQGMRLEAGFDPAVVADGRDFGFQDLTGFGP